VPLANMDSSAAKRPFAWQPLTPRGVSAFAYARPGRLLAIQLVVALLTAGTVVWFLHVAWFPVVGQAVSQLPASGEIRAGTLDWHADSPVSLAEGRFLALTVDLKHSGVARSPAHVQVEFGQAGVKILSLLGFIERPYPPGRTIPFNRQDLVPWWGAWAPALLGIAALLVISGLMITWAVLATVYALPVGVLGFFANRDLNLVGSWRLAGAALMPGALLMGAAIFLYGSGAFGLIELAVAAGVHLVVGWAYLIASPLRLPLLPAATAGRENPFLEAPKPADTPARASKAADAAPAQPKD
jgi:hypothetical protein